MPRVKHVALFRFRSDTPPEKLREIFAVLAGLRRTIPGLLDFSGGPYASPEGLGKGFNWGFVMTFQDESSRNAYLPHPDHQAVVRLILPWLEGGLEGVIAFDWMENS